MAGVYDCTKRQSGRISPRLPQLAVAMVVPAVLIAVLLLLGVRAPARAQDDPLATDTANIEDEIVYIDAAGHIRVFDPRQPDNVPPVAFRSPDAGWIDAAVGDVNGDGDDEIVAIGENGLLKVYDPVIASGPVPPENVINGIYWEELYATILPNRALLVDTGNFDAEPTTDEIVAVYVDPNNATSSFVQIYYQPLAPFDGRTWLPLTDVAASELWSDVATGNLDGAGVDELALVNEDLGALRVYRLEGNNVLNPFFISESDTKPWSDVAIGNVDNELVLPELVAVRNAAPPLPALVVQRYKSPDAFEDVGTRELLPSPRVVFLADVTGNGDEEMYLLRDVPAGDARPRLFISNLGIDGMFAFEVPLDTDNGYRYGAGGDIDGDGKDELAVVRDTGFKIFESPETNINSYTVTLETNARTIVMGNLDALGKDRLTADVTRFDLSVNAGKQSSVQQLRLTNLTRPSNPVRYDIRLLPQVSFIRLSQISGDTPGTVSLTADATELLPATDPKQDPPRYGTNLVVTALDPLVANSPLTIPVIVEVLPGVAVRPSGIAIAAQVDPNTSGCTNLQLDENQNHISVLGTPESTFSVSVVFGQSSTAQGWLTASISDTAPITSGTVPSQIGLTLHPEIFDKPGAYSATVVIDAQVADQAQTPITLRVPVNVICTNEALYLPTVRR
ncbi:MAG TPA: hypothetical protein P5333_10925 [Caldilinea sp.]|nr:hypothetical protein [Caldilinea sp.]